MQEYDQTDFDRFILSDLGSKYRINKYVYRGVAAYDLIKGYITCYEFIYINKWGRVRIVSLYHPRSEPNVPTRCDYTTDPAELNYTLQLARYKIYSLTGRDLYIETQTPPKFLSEVQVSDIFAKTTNNEHRARLLDLVPVIRYRDYTNYIPQQSQLIRLLLSLITTPQT